MAHYDDVKAQLRAQPQRWLVTGAAGFIGANLARTLLDLDQEVVGLDNFATGTPDNVDRVRALVGDKRAARYDFLEGDIRNPDDCQRACKGTQRVLHQAALGSVPRSISDPLTSHTSNVNGFLNMLIAARDAGVQRFVYASSSSVYGDEPTLPKLEQRIGRPLSPYAATKITNEHYAHAFNAAYGLACLGLRYFNVFGPMQSPSGPYAAVIPRWVETLLNGDQPLIFGDGLTSRDFCYVDNAVQANILAAMAPEEGVKAAVFNVAVGERTTLNELFAMIRDELAKSRPGIADTVAKHEDFRPGDIRHSLADISRAQEHLGYQPTHTVSQGLHEALAWYVEQIG